MCRPTRKKTNLQAASGLKEKQIEKGAYGSWHVWLVGSAAFLCYANSLSCGLVFDDQPAIRDNADLRPETPVSNLLHDDFWGTPMHREESHKSYRPLCVLTFRLNYWIHGLQPFGYHLINALLHTLVTLQYYSLCCKILHLKSSVVASLLFAIHPIHTEAVTGIVGRAELLSAAFFLLSLRTYLQSRRRKEPPNGITDTLISLLFAGLAMLGKEQGITVVAVCVTYDILLVQKASGPPLPLGRRGKIKGPTPTWRKDLVLRLLVMTTGATLMLTARMRLMGNKLPVFNRFDNPASSEVWPTRHLTHLYLGCLNAWLLCFPADLCCDWTMGTVPLLDSFLDLRLIPTFAFYAVICALGWKGGHYRGKKSKIVVLGASLCVFPFLPVSNLLYPVGFVVAERVLYIPSMGFCILIAHGFNKLCIKYRSQQHILHGLIVILMCLHVAKTINRNSDWRDEESLFESGLRVTRSNAKLYNNLGHVLESKDRSEEALRLFLQAAQIQPDDLGSHLNVGRMYNILGMTENAEKAFRMAKTLLPKAQPGKPYQTHIVPRHLDLFLNLGKLLSNNQSRLEEAQELYREAISMKADYIAAYLQRASVLLKLNRSEEAHDMYEEALKHDRMNPDIFYNMGVLLLGQGKSHQALSRFDQALQVDPEHEKSLLNYAILTQNSGDTGLRRLAHERLQLVLGKGQQPERTYFNLGMLSMQDGDTTRAEGYFRKALEVRGDFGAALFNLGLVLSETGRHLDAVPYLLRLSEKHTKGMLLLGNIYFGVLANYTAAQNCYELVLKQEPTNVPALHNLCATLFQLGKHEKAAFCRQPLRRHAKNYQKTPMSPGGTNIANDRDPQPSNKSFGEVSGNRQLPFYSEDRRTTWR